MKNQTNTSLVIHSSLALALALLIWSPSQVTSAEGEEEKKTTPNQNCQIMKDQIMKVMTDTKTQDAQLTTLVAGMNSATQDKKVDLMAAIVTRMSEQQTAMHARKADMEKNMAQHMMGHMEMGKESMSQCPMMKMKGMDEKSEANHDHNQKEPK